MTERRRGQTRRRTRPTVDARAADELELDDYDDDDEGDVTPITEGRSRAERRRADRRRDRARKKRIVIADETPDPIVIELIGVEYEIVPPDMGVILDLADAAEGSLSPKDQLIEWIDAAFTPDDADDVLDRIDAGEVKWGAISRLMQAVTAAGRNPTG